MVGIDMVSIGRIKRACELNCMGFLSRILNKSEIELCLRQNISMDMLPNTSHLDDAPPHALNPRDTGVLDLLYIERVAGFYALKEAIAKALGSGICKELSFKDIIITKDVRGAPAITFAHGSVHEGKRFAVSISHDGGLAIAIAMIV